VAWGVADTNVNIELVLDVNTCSGCLVDTSSDCDDADYPMDFTHLIKDSRGHADGIQLR
jgi:hypothetical protein